EMAVVLITTWTLKAGKFEEKHGRMLKLIGGIIMLSLATVMLVNPDLMNDIGNSLLIFGGSIILSFVIVFVHRTFFSQLGTEFKGEKNLDSKEKK
ncbi:MAG: hypothetical protein ACOC1P_02490, partial [Minisyncoccales bacterium]